MNDQEMLEYLEKIHSMTKGRSLESVVYQHGRPFIAPYRPRPWGIRRMTPNQCFRNAYQFAQANTGWTYVEGFAAGRVGYPMQHAWVVDRSQTLIELTWKQPGTAYYGIEFPDWDLVHRILLDTEVYGILNFTSPTFIRHFGLR